jgi:hypothetical protein
MRNILVSMALVSLSFIASARSLDMTPVVATVSGHQHGIKQVTLLTDGRLQVTSEADDVQTVQLSQTALQSLVNSARYLSAAEIRSSTHQIVCEMITPETLSNLSIGKYNEQQDSFEGSETRTVLTSQGCQYIYMASPVEAWAQESAQSLRASLVILALNSLK